MKVAGAGRGVTTWALMICLALMATGSIAAGLGMIGGGVGIPDSWLERTPFTSWVIPGVALILIVGVPQSVALLALIVQHRDASLMTFVAGLLLMGWIVVEVAWMRRFNVLQPLCFLIGLLEAGLAKRSMLSFDGGRWV